MGNILLLCGRPNIEDVCCPLAAAIFLLQNKASRGFGFMNENLFVGCLTYSVKRE